MENLKLVERWDAINNEYYDLSSRVLFGSKTPDGERLKSLSHERAECFKEIFSALKAIYVSQDGIMGTWVTTHSSVEFFANGEDESKFFARNQPYSRRDLGMLDLTHATYPCGTHWLSYVSCLRSLSEGKKVGYAK